MGEVMFAFNSNELIWLDILRLNVDNVFPAPAIETDNLAG